MIEKWYEVTCDYCNWALNHYIGNKPTREELEDDGFIVYKGMVFCGEECFENWKKENKLNTLKK